MRQAYVRATNLSSNFRELNDGIAQSEETACFDAVCNTRAMINESNEDFFALV
jgi:hypothetical protein